MLGNIIYLMSITREVFDQSPEPKPHDKVLENKPDRIGKLSRPTISIFKSKGIWH